MMRHRDDFFPCQFATFTKRLFLLPINLKNEIDLLYASRYFIDFLLAIPIMKWPAIFQLQFFPFQKPWLKISFNSSNPW